MPPAPARIASTPRQNSRTSWNPAVPPPPVPGAAVGGDELADGLGDGDGLGLGAAALGAPALGAPVLGAPVLGAAVLGAAVLGAAVLGAAVLGAAVLGAAVLGVLLVVVALGAPAEIAGVAGPVPPGENGVGVVDGEPPAQ